MSSVLVVGGTALVQGSGKADTIGVLAALGALVGEVLFSLLAAAVLPRLGAIRVAAYSCGLAVPSGRCRTDPVTLSTCSDRMSWAPSTTHCTMPVWSRRSTNARCSPCSRRRATQPHTDTRRSTSCRPSSPQ